MKKKTLLSWSSGKDSAWTLHVLRQSAEYEVVGLVTTVNQKHQRVAMHAVRTEFLESQADAAGLPMHTIPIPHPCSNEQYATAMSRFIEQAREQDIECMAFGDLFLRDVRDYRVKQLRGTGITPIFPLWEIPTSELIQDMLAAKLRAVITCLDPRHLPPQLAGRQLDQTLLEELPEEVDPCGEYGEFHTFCFDGPMFHKPVAIQTGEVVERDGFVFADLLPHALDCKP